MEVTDHEAFAFVDGLKYRSGSNVLGIRSGCTAARRVEDDYGN